MISSADSGAFGRNPFAADINIKVVMWMHIEERGCTASVFLAFFSADSSEGMRELQEHHTFCGRKVVQAVLEVSMIVLDPWAGVLTCPSKCGGGARSGLRIA